MVNQINDIPDNYKVLIVEDDLILSIALSMMLKKIGFNNVEKVVNADEARDKMDEFAPDLLIMDINLGPGISGIDFVKEIQDSNQVDVIYITGNSDMFNRMQAGETDYIDYLTKPVTPAELKKSLSKLFSGVKK
ncbi:MAG: response regulator [Balneolaceae bacterium]